VTLAHASAGSIAAAITAAAPRFDPAGSEPAKRRVQGPPRRDSAGGLRRRVFANAQTNDGNAV